MLKFLLFLLLGPRPQADASRAPRQALGRVKSHHLFLSKLAHFAKRSIFVSRKTNGRSRVFPSRMLRDDGSSQLARHAFVPATYAPCAASHDVGPLGRARGVAGGLGCRSDAGASPCVPRRRISHSEMGPFPRPALFFSPRRRATYDTAAAAPWLRTTARVFRSS